MTCNDPLIKSFLHIIGSESCDVDFLGVIKQSGDSVCCKILGPHGGGHKDGSST